MTQEETAIKELLEITNAMKSAKLVVDLFIDHLEIPPESLELMEKVKTLVKEELDSLFLKLVPIYTKHVTLEEIKDLIKFYKTPLGRKLLSVNLKILQESVEISSLWGEDLRSKLEQLIISGEEHENSVNKNKL